MPVPSIRAARVAVMSAFKTHWDANGGGVAVQYDGVRLDLPDGDTPWVRIQMRHFGARRVTVGTPARFRHTGVVAVQVFTPLEDNDGLTQNDLLAQTAANAFRNRETAPDAVSFREVRATEVGPDGAWFLTNVLADFEWDEMVA